MEILLSLILPQIKTNTQISWDVVSLHWESTVREVFYLGGEVESTILLRWQQWLKEGAASDCTGRDISEESQNDQQGMVEHVIGDIPFLRTEYNADHAQMDAEEKMKCKDPMAKSGKHYALMKKLSV